MSNNNQQARYTFNVLLLVLLGFASAVAHAAPANLPMARDVPRGASQPIDGVWTISTLGKRIRIQGGRAFAIDSWTHLLTQQVRPGMVVLKNIRRSSAGKYSGRDLPLAGRFQARLNSKGRLDVRVKGPLGVSSYQLIPRKPSRPLSFRKEVRIAMRDHGRPPSVRPPHMPGPKPRPRPVRNDPTPGCGGFGETPCIATRAIKRAKARKLGCPGKQSYYSNLRGGSCWVCPRGYKRTARRMDSRKACVERGKLVGARHTRARFQKKAFGCPSGQHNLLGRCYSCPRGYRWGKGVRVSSKKACKAVKACDAGLRIAKRPPRFKRLLASLVGSKKGKVCAPPFNIKRAARQNLPAFNQLKGAAKEYLRSGAGSKRSVKRYARAVKRKDWRAVANQLVSQQGFMRVIRVARKLGYPEVSIGVAGDASIIGGVNAEIGVVVNTRTGALRPYIAGGISKGAAVSLDGSYTLGFWKGSFESGHTQGVTGSVSGVVSLGGGAWFTYFDPARRVQERLAGFTFSAGVGLGAEFGEYNEVGTKVFPRVITLPLKI